MSKKLPPAEVMVLNDKDTPENLNGGPYGRDKIPIVPPKPVHFSLWRPIRGAIGGLLYGLLMQFDSLTPNYFSAAI